MYCVLNNYREYVHKTTIVCLLYEKKIFFSPSLGPQLIMKNLVQHIIVSELMCQNSFG